MLTSQAMPKRKAKIYREYIIVIVMSADNSLCLGLFCSFLILYMAASVSSGQSSWLHNGDVLCFL
jgi:hypothetical protein